MLVRTPPVATVAINLKPRNGSWGGANQWASQLVRYLRFCGYRVRFDLKRQVDAIVMTHTGLSDGTTFSSEAVAAYRLANPGVKCLHRINDNDIRKGTDAMDPLLARANEVADHTVFVSGWLRDHHASKWFDASRPHSVIAPGADPSVFFPGRRRITDGKCRVVTHHWSNNWAKGFDVYRDVDRAIASGGLEGFELHIVGRWPDDLDWESAKTHPPASGHGLAKLLRSCDLYISASRHEPGAMHVVEGLQCGLPLVYHLETGGTVEMGRRYGVGIGGDVVGALQEARGRITQLRRALLAEPPSGDLMCLAYRRILQMMIVHED